MISGNGAGLKKGKTMKTLVKWFVKRYVTNKAVTLQRRQKAETDFKWELL